MIRPHGCDMSAHLVIFIALLRLLSPRRLFVVFHLVFTYVVLIDSLFIAPHVLLCVRWHDG